MQITGVSQHHLGGSFAPVWIPGVPQGTHEFELFVFGTGVGLKGYAPGLSFAAGVHCEASLNVFRNGMDPHTIDPIRRELESITLIGPRSRHLELDDGYLSPPDAPRPRYRSRPGGA